MRCLLLVIISLYSFTLFAQERAEAQFSSTLFNFEVLKEVDGKVHHDFIFVNKGKVPIIIKKVKTTCGCMVPDWTRHPVLPGKKGFIRATFDPTNRPGNFDKTITVYTNSRNPVHVLRIRGKVIPKKRTILDDYPYELPCGMRMIYDHLSFTSILENKIKKIEIPVYNNHDKRLSVKFPELPPYLKIQLVPEVLDIKGKGIIIAEYDAGIKNDLGLLKDNIDFYANGEKFNMLVSANIKQDFSALSDEQRESSPSISVDKKYFSFGNIDNDKVLLRLVNITNKGKSKLLIKKVYSFNKHIFIDLPQRQLEPGRSVVLNITLNPKGLHGKQKIIVGLISNDPTNPEIKIRLSGFVN